MPRRARQYTLMSGARRTTRRGRVVPARRIQRVLNPLSGRRLQVGGARFNRLTAVGGPLRRVRRNNLAIDYGDSIHITHILDPSDGTIVERDSMVAVPLRDRAMVRAVVEGREDYFYRMADWVADNWVPQLGQYVGRFEYGPREWTRVEEDDQGDLQLRQPVGRMQDRAGVVRFLRQRGIRASEPLVLPFINVACNAGGTEGQCIQRFLGCPLLDPDDTSVRGIIATAERHALPVRLVDLMGQTIAECNVAAAASAPPLLVGLIYNQHVYPLLDGDLVPVLNRGNGPDYQGIPQMHERLNQMNYMMYRVNHAFYTPDGVCNMAGSDTGLYEDWMAKLFAVTPPALGLDDQTLEILRRGTIGLYFADRPPGTVLDPVEFVAIDMSKCYYNTLVEMLEKHRLPTLSLYDYFEPVAFEFQLTEQIVGPNDLLLIDTDLTRYGFRTNVINGQAYEYWIEFNKPPMRVLGVLRLRNEELVAQRHMLAELRKYTAEQQKKYAVMNGMFGKLKSCSELWLEVRDPVEQEYYEEEHGLIPRGSGCMSKSVVKPIANSRFHVYQAVVHSANARVLYHMLHIERNVPGAGLPAKIKIDSLTYERRRLRTPFDPTGERALRQYVTNDQWHFEPLRIDLPLVQPMLYRYLTPTSCADAVGDYSRNITFIGPPGVGKTYQALQLEPDLSICFSNKGARRIGGITVDSALGMRPGLYQLAWDREKIAGKRVFVDEAQALRPRHWGILKFAYLHLGTSFIFALDPDQIPPVEHERYPVSEHPFWGDVRRLTVDHRNAPCLIAAREAVLAGTFEPELADVGTPVGLFNIAYTNRTCDKVNRLVAPGWLHRGGRYIVKIPHPKSGLCKGEILYRGNDNKWHRDEMDGPVVEGTFSDQSAKRYVKFAYCVTIHNTIGETFRMPYTIWDIKHPGFSRRLLYTALTRGISLEQITFRDKCDLV